MKLFKKQIKILLPILLLLSPVLATADKDVIWKDGNNIYFKYEKQKRKSSEKNSHPVDLNAEEITTVTKLLNIQKKEIEPMFTLQQAKLLGQNLATGLKNAKPEQDVTFVMEKTISNAKSSLFKGRQYFVAGRAFYQNGKLNIIIGDYDRIRDRGYEAAVDPTNVGVVNYNFDHGRRSAKSKGLKNSIILPDGIEQKIMQGKNRNDWLVLDLKTAITAHTQQTEAQKEEEILQKRKELEKILGVGSTAPAIETGTKKVEYPEGYKQPEGHKYPEGYKQPEGHKYPEGYKQPEGHKYPDGYKQPEGKMQPSTSPPIKTDRSLEERLTTLNQLKSKGLITEQEYAEKRQQILDEL